MSEKRLVKTNIKGRIMDGDLWIRAEDLIIHCLKIGGPEMTALAGFLEKMKEKSR